MCAAINIMHKAYGAAYGVMPLCFQRQRVVQPWEEADQW